MIPKRFMFPLAFVSIVLLAATILWLPYLQPHASNHDTPLAFDPPIIDLGAVSPQENTTVTTTLCNTGSTPIKIVAVGTSCTCTTTSLRPRTLMPGERVSVAFAIDTRIFTEQFASSINVSYGKGLVAACTAYGRVVPLATATPRSLAFNLPTSTPKAIIELTHDTALHPVVSIATTYRGIVAKTMPGTPGQTKTRIEITVDPTAFDGTDYLQEYVLVYLKDGGRTPMKLPVAIQHSSVRNTHR